MAKHSPQRIQASYTHCRANKFCNSELVNCSASRYPSSGSPLPCIRLEEWQYLKSSNGVTEKRWLLHLHCLPELTGQQNKFMIDIDRLCCASFGRDGELNVVFLSHAHISFGVYMCVYMCVCVCVCVLSATTSRFLFLLFPAFFHRNPVKQGAPAIGRNQRQFSYSFMAFKKPPRFLVRCHQRVQRLPLGPLLGSSRRAPSRAASAAAAPPAAP